MNPKACFLLLSVFLLAACLPATKRFEETRLSGLTVIENDQVWSGIIRISGIVTVGRQGSLAIQPGTTVLFDRIDEDGDGVGDAEIWVEGKLLVKGEPDKPVVFTSSAPQPKPADWKYIYCNQAVGVELLYADISYAFSGIQIHYTNAVVTGCRFRRNIDGLRFSTARLRAVGNLMTENQHGIRYEERGGEGEIEGNVVIGNRVGVFAVTKAANRTKISGNNLGPNLDYNFKLGVAQAGDLEVPGNWWGTDDPSTFENLFLDSRIDSSLGTIRYEPFLNQGVEVSTPSFWRAE